MQIINPLVHTTWNGTISSIPETTVFYTREWAQLLAHSYGYMPAFFLSRAGREINFLLPIMEVDSRLTGRRGIALPFTDFCAPYAKNKEIFDDGWAEIRRYGELHRWKYVEIRGGAELFSNETPSLVYLHHYLQLDEEKKLFAKLSSGHRRNLRKAQKNHLTISIDQSHQSLLDFYRLNCFTRKKHGLPPQPRHFFENFYKFLLNQQMATIVSAKFEHRTIAASVFLHFKDEVIYKYGASHPSYLNLRANHLVMWEAMKYFSEQGYQKLSFGKTDLSHAGLQRFKLGFGAEEEKINYYKCSFDGHQFVTDNAQESGWHTAIFRRMPIPLLKLMGRLLYKHVA